MFGGQVTVVLLQVLYASLTSRMVPPESFGAYAVALAMGPLILLLATAGLGNAAARAPHITETDTRALATISLGMGLVAFALISFLAGPWSSLWGNHQALAATRWAAVSVLPIPLVGLLGGMLRRTGRFRQLSLATTVASILGMSLGALSVWHYRSASSLVAMSIVTAVAQVVILLKIVGSAGWPGHLRVDVMEHLRFGSKVVLANGLGYLTGAGPQLAISRGVGAAVLGSFNRATVLTQVPMEMIQNSLVQVLYPEFRHDIGRRARTAQLWSDLLMLVSWIMFPIGAVVSAGAYFLLPYVLGPGWDVAGSIATWIAISSALHVPVVFLGSAFEATGRFSGVWSARISGVVTAGASAVAALLLQAIEPVLFGLVITPIGCHLFQLRFASQHEIFGVRPLLREYFRILLVAAGLGTVTALILFILTTTNASIPVKSLGLTLVVILAIVALRLTFWHLPPVRIAQRYGLFSRS